MKAVKIGLLGIGNVGTGTYKILEMNKAHITKVTGSEITVTKILAKNIYKKREIQPAIGVLTSDPEEIWDDPEIDIVVEALGGIEPATTFMLCAMNAGKHVVTANKAAVAANYKKLTAAAKANNVQFKFEASVGGGIPILNALTTTLQGNEFIEILGIINGTTNYIMTQMTEYGLTYDDVLKTAQEKGFAESDPTADVEGIDVANKLSILIALAFDKYIAPSDIPTVGISKITNEDIEAAKKQECKIKLIASARMHEGKLTYGVRPELIPYTHPLADVNNEYNAVFVTGNAVGELMFYGKGAGTLPTGSAVVGDIIQIAKM